MLRYQTRRFLLPYNLLLCKPLTVYLAVFLSQIKENQCYSLRTRQGEITVRHLEFWKMSWNCWSLVPVAGTPMEWSQICPQQHTRTNTILKMSCNSSLHRAAWLTEAYSTSKLWSWVPSQGWMLEVRFHPTPHCLADMSHLFSTSVQTWGR